MIEPVHIISLGAGVQSSTMALMAAAGEIIPMPIAAIFADTQDEPAAVYRWLDWIEKQLPFPIHRVTKGSLSEGVLRTRIGKNGAVFSHNDIPFFTKNKETGKQGMVKFRDCTRSFKVQPIMTAARKIAKVPRGCKEVRVIQWIGISLDEMQRMKPARGLWAESRWPLIEKRMTRMQCLSWMESHGYPVPPRSACVYCPYHSNNEWRNLRDNHPQDFQRAVDFEKQLHATLFNPRTESYLHRSCVPLDQVDLTTDVERGQGLLDGFDDECSGMCGV